MRDRAFVGGRAYTPSLRIPIVLLAIGAAFLVYGGLGHP
jgi:hypothetical protein